MTPKLDDLYTYFNGLLGEQDSIELVDLAEFVREFPVVFTNRSAAADQFTKRFPSQVYKAIATMESAKVKKLRDGENVWVYWGGWRFLITPEDVELELLPKSS